MTDDQAQRLYYVMKNGDWTLQLRPGQEAEGQQPLDGHVHDGARRRQQVTTFATGSRKETLRVVVTGTFDGESDLHEALDASGSGLDVVAWTTEVRDAVPYLGMDDVDAVLLGAGRSGGSAAAVLRDGGGGDPSAHAGTDRAPRSRGLQRSRRDGPQARASTTCSCCRSWPRRSRSRSARRTRQVAADARSALMIRMFLVAAS